jgi:hypothetical protein
MIQSLPQSLSGNNHAPNTCLVATLHIQTITHERGKGTPLHPLQNVLRSEVKTSH